MDRIKINWPLTPPKNDTAAEKEKKCWCRSDLVSEKWVCSEERDGCVSVQE